MIQIQVHLDKQRVMTNDDYGDDDNDANDADSPWEAKGEGGWWKADHQPGKGHLLDSKFDILNFKIKI